jgi:hypothetical protein
LLLFLSTIAWIEDIYKLNSAKIYGTARIISRTYTLIVVTALLISPPLLACPALLTFDDLPSAPYASNRNSWRLYTLKNKPDGAKTWAREPLQNDPRRKNGNYIWPSQKNLARSHVESQDLLAFQTSNFTKTWLASKKLPCKAKQAYRISTQSKGQPRHGLLVYCSEKTSLSKEIISPVTFDRQKNYVTSKSYEYKFWPTNHLIFDSITLNPKSKDSRLIISRNANQLFRADIKNFFTLTFDRDDVESNLQEIVQRPLGILGRLTFFLRILFFKIDLKLNSAVNFFEDSVFVPMIVNFPSDAPSRVHPSSGILFSWQIDRQQMKWLHSKDDIPILDPDLIPKGYQRVAQEGLKFCGKKNCNFRIRGSYLQHKWEMLFILKRSLVKRGFFPFLTMNSDKSAHDLKWMDSPSEDRQRIALYFETSGLTKGEHPYEFWIQVAPPGKELEDQCPSPVSVKSIKL